MKKKGVFSLSVITGTYQNPVVILLSGLGVSQSSYFCSWFQYFGRCGQKVSLRFPQWRRTGWAFPHWHTLVGPLSSCQSEHRAESPLLLPPLLVHHKKHAAGKERVSPYPCLANLQECQEKKQSEHTHLLLSADQLGTTTCTPVSGEDSIRNGGKKSNQPHPLPNIPQPGHNCRALSNHVAVPGGGVLLADRGKKMPWEGLLLVGKSCLWGSYPSFLLSG